MAALVTAYSAPQSWQTIEVVLGSTVSPASLDSVDAAEQFPHVISTASIRAMKPPLEVDARMRSILKIPLVDRPIRPS